MARGGMVTAVVLLCVLAARAPSAAEAQVTCEMVVRDLVPCATYLTAGGPVSPECCNGVRSLNAAAVTTADRQVACRCMQQTASTLPGINMDNASSLPGKCNVDIPYTISPGTDCSQVQ